MFYIQNSAQIDKKDNANAKLNSNIERGSRRAALASRDKIYCICPALISLLPVAGTGPLKI